MPQTFGEPPITVSDAEFNEAKNLIENQVQAFRDRTKGSVSNKLLARRPDWNSKITELAQLFLIGKTVKRQEAFTDFARILQEDFGLATPSTGALWGGDGAQDKAKADLASGPGKVLSESPLGLTAGKLKLAPQGPKANETGQEFAARNEAALQFWGAVSALYAKGLTGDIHVWMPHGLTVGSIFWNDELPVLMKRKRDGENFNLIFHVNPANWSETVNFEDLVIGGAYVADRKGFYQGRAALKATNNPPTGSDPAADLKDSMTLKLSSPIKVTTVRAAMQALLTYTVMKKHNEQLKIAHTADPSTPAPVSPAVLAKLAMWRERARQNVEASKV